MTTWAWRLLKRLGILESSLRKSILQLSFTVLAFTFLTAGAVAGQESSDSSARIWLQASQPAGQANPVAAQSGQAVTVDIPSVAPLGQHPWYWRWGALLGLTAVACIACFKNPKRLHDN